MAKSKSYKKKFFKYPDGGKTPIYKEYTDPVEYKKAVEARNDSLNKFNETQRYIKANESNRQEILRRGISAAPHQVVQLSSIPYRTRNNEVVYFELPPYNISPSSISGLQSIISNADVTKNEYLRNYNSGIQPVGWYRSGPDAAHVYPKYKKPVVKPVYRKKEDQEIIKEYTDPIAYEKALKARKDSFDAYNSSALVLKALDAWNKNPTEENKKKYYEAQDKNFSYMDKNQPVGSKWSIQNAPDKNPDFYEIYKKPVVKPVFSPFVKQEEPAKGNVEKIKQDTIKQSKQDSNTGWLKKYHGDYMRFQADPNFETYIDYSSPWLGPQYYIKEKQNKAYGGYIKKYPDGGLTTKRDATSIGYKNIPTLEQIKQQGEIKKKKDLYNLQLRKRLDDLQYEADSIMKSEISPFKLMGIRQEAGSILQYLQQNAPELIKPEMLTAKAAGKGMISGSKYIVPELQPVIEPIETGINIIETIFDPSLQNMTSSGIDYITTKSKNPRITNIFNKLGDVQTGYEIKNLIDQSKESRQNIDKKLKDSNIKAYGGYIHNNMAGKLNKRKGLPTRFPMYYTGGTPEMYMGTSDYFDKQNQIAGQNAALTNLAAQGLSFVPGWGQTASVALKAGQAASNLVGQKDMYGVAPTGFQQAAAATLDPLGTINSLVQGQNPYAYKKMLGEEGKLATSYGRGKTAEQQDAYTQQMKAAEGQYMAMGGYMPMYAPGGITDPMNPANPIKGYAMTLNKDVYNALKGDYSGQGYASVPGYKGFYKRDNEYFNIEPTGAETGQYGMYSVADPTKPAPTPVNILPPPTKVIPTTDNKSIFQWKKINPWDLENIWKEREKKGEIQIKEDKGDYYIKRNYAMGGRITNPYNGEPNAEIEGEVVSHSNGGIQDFSHLPNHEQATPANEVNLAEGSKILSKRITDPLTGKKFATVGKKYSTSREENVLNNNRLPELSNRSAKLSLMAKKKAFDDVFERHEATKVFNDAQKAENEATEDFIGMLGGMYGKGGLIKRKDGSYSPRGLWDNIRANRGSGKKPTKAMLEQEKKIKAKYLDGGNVNGNPPYTTKLNPQEEIQFKNWYDKLSKYKGLSNNPDNQYYDMRGYWKENPNERENWFNKSQDVHFTDKYKQPGHPTFSNESIYSNEKTPGGTWTYVEKGNKWYYHPSKYTSTPEYKRKTIQYLRENYNDKEPTFPIYGKDTINVAPLMLKEKAMGGYMYAEGGSFNNPGFKALPEYVQAKIMNNYEAGGYVLGESYDMSEEELQELKNQGYTFDIE